MNDSSLKFYTLPRNMTEVEFVSVFGGVYEHTPSIAAQTWQTELGEAHDTVEGIAVALAATADSFSRDELLQLINAHPDLAGRAAVAGELTAESTSEQAGAGIDQCNAEEFALFENYNRRYKEKFGFNFIMAVKGSNRFQILDNFEQRLENEVEVEFRRALQEIHKIARFRLREIAEQSSVN